MAYKYNCPFNWQAQKKNNLGEEAYKLGCVKPQPQPNTVVKYMLIQQNLSKYIYLPRYKNSLKRQPKNIKMFGVLVYASRRGGKTPPA